MTGLSHQALARERPVTPFVERAMDPKTGLSYGNGPATYDVRLRRTIWLFPLCHRLASTIEYLTLPAHLKAKVLDKYTWARRKVKLAGTFIDPGFRGYLTLEIYVPTLFAFPRRIRAGTPIAQLEFDYLNEPTDYPYVGRYQDQPDRPISAR